MTNIKTYHANGLVDFDGAANLVKFIDKRLVAATTSGSYDLDLGRNVPLDNIFVIPTVTTGEERYGTQVILPTAAIPQHVVAAKISDNVVRITHTPRSITNYYGAPLHPHALPTITQIVVFIDA